MTRMFRVDCVREGSANYFKGLEKYVGKVLEVNNGVVGDQSSIALYVPDKSDYWYFDNEWLTEVTEQYNFLNPEPKIKSPLDKQVSGTHYKDCGIQPIEYIHANGLNYFEGNAVKYITRHRKKNGKADIEKAIHYLELMLELEYKEEK